MGDVIVVDVARDFSRTPGGRYAREGLASGEEFRTRVLEPILDRNEEARVLVDLDSAAGFTSSFLEEAFGGLARRYGPSVRRRVFVRAPEHPARACKAKAFLIQALAELPSVDMSES